MSAAASETGTALRRGWTTGACATAAAVAAYRHWQDGSAPAAVTVALPKGLTPSFAVAGEGIDGQGRPWAGIVKDGGDDPDVTHGAFVWAAVAAGPAGSGVTFHAGTGVGTATLAGLPISPGEPAINPRPRAMIADNLARTAAETGGPADIAVTVGISDGEALAQHTWNPRLGITGGLSVLGTTGVVVPYSCSAWIDSIHRGVDVAREQGYRHVLAATGASSEAAVAALYPDRPQTAIIDMGDFAGGLFKYLRRYPVPAITVAGGFAKLAKLGQGYRDLHSGRSQVDQGRLATWLAELGADRATQGAAAEAPSAGAVLAQAREAGLALGDRVAAAAQAEAEAMAGEAGPQIEVVVTDRGGTVVGRAGAAGIAALREAGEEAGGGPCMS